MSIKTLLHEEIENEFDTLDEVEKGSEKYKVTVDGAAKLLDRAIELERLEIERQDKAYERELKQTQMKEDKIDRWVKNGLTAASIIGGFGLTVWGSLKAWKFEETGTITSTAGRKFMSYLFFKK